MNANIPTMLTAYCALVQYLQFSYCMGPEKLWFSALNFIWASSWAFGTFNLHLPHDKKESDKSYTMENLQFEAVFFSLIIQNRKEPHKISLSDQMVLSM